MTALRKSRIVAFRVDDGGNGLLDALRARGEQLGVIARRDLERYYRVLAGETVPLSLEETQRLVDADIATLVKRLEALTPLQRCTLIDALERTAYDQRHKDNPDTDAALRAAQLVRI